MSVKPRILIVDDDSEFIRDFVLLLEGDYECLTARHSTEALRLIVNQNPQVVLLDLMLGNENGLDVLQQILAIDKNIPVIMVTDYASVETAVSAMQKGAFDYITKSPNMNELRLLIEKSFRQRNLSLQRSHLKEQVDRPYDRMIGESEVMVELTEKITLYARHPANILITGESGVGKELVARQIHRHSPQRNAPFIAVNCAAIPRELAESELFGHEKGAYTGADKRVIGKFEHAADGIIFMDEISELTQDIQVKLLRVLQEREYSRVGGSGVIKTNAKVIAASNQDLRQCVREGTFREDLYYRLDVLPIEVPPLRKRKKDIPLLIRHFIEQECRDMKLPVKTISEDIIELFTHYDWPGNIRQLRNFITRAVILSSDTEIHFEHIDPILHTKDRSLKANSFIPAIPKTWDEMDDLRKKASVKASRIVEKSFVEYLLAKYDGNIARAARETGINRTNLHKIIKRVDSEYGAL